MFKKLWAGLQKTREKISQGLKSLFSIGRKLDEAFIEELEEVLFTTDMGQTASKIIDQVKAAYKRREIEEPSQVYDFLRNELTRRLHNDGGSLRFAPTPPTVVLIVGVNGSGKTTSIAKLANYLKNQDKSVMLGACDTFRAAAVEQLTIWSDRAGVQIIKGAHNAEPAAVAFDAAQAALARKVDVLIVDTAGRLHTQQNLMKELHKIRSVLGRVIPDAPHEVLLVLDATTGQNAVNQAREFKAATAVTGLILAKLDGTAKGGAVVSIRDQIDIPVKFVGVGEKIDDLEVFEPASFANALLQVDSG